MTINRLLLFGIFAMVWTQIVTPSKIIAHTNCESYLDCHQNSENLEKVDDWTNYFFKLLRPEMRNKRIRIHHTLYRRERAEIRQVVNRVVYRKNL